MRHPIEKSPRDGTAIILEDDASGTYDVAHWSTETGQWLGENGEPTKITPTHWHAMPRDQYLTREDKKSHSDSRPGRARRLLRLDCLTLVAVAFRRHVFRRGGRGDCDAVRRQFRADQASAPAEAQQAAQERQIAVVPEAQQTPDDQLGRSSLGTPDPLSRGSMCSCRWRPPITHKRSNRNGKSSRPRAGSRRRAAGADREHDTTSSSARRGARVGRRTRTRTRGRSARK